MIPEERNSYTLTEEEAIIFATAKFKPFHNRLEEDELYYEWKMNFF